MSHDYGDYLECCGLDTGWFGSSIVKSIGHAAKSVVNATAKYNPISAQAKLATALASGRNVKAATADFARDNIANLRAGAAHAPGGAKILAAVDSAIKVGKGASVKDTAMGAVRQNLPPDQQKAFDAAVGLAKGGGTPQILVNARSFVAGTPELRAAFDSGVAIAKKATPTQFRNAIAKHTSPAAKNVIAKVAMAHAAIAQHVAPAKPQLRTLTPPKRAHVGRRVRSLSPRAKAFVLSRARRRGTAALKNENTYVVENNDSAFRIAQNLTGSPTAPIAPSKIPPWKELLMANRQKNINDGYNKVRALKPGEVPTNAMNFSFLKTGEELHVPQNWIDAARAQAAKKLGIAPPPPRPPAGAPTSVVAIPAPGPKPAAPPPAAALPVPAVAVVPGASQGARDDAQAIAQAKMILAAWGATDGAGSVTLADYGSTPGDVSPLWGSRDNLELASFVGWANKHGSKLATTGDLTQAKLDALVAWAEAKSKVVAPTTPPPAVDMTGPVAAQKPADPPPNAPPALPGPASEPATVAPGIAAPAPVSPIAQAGMGSSMPGGEINVPETLIAGNPKSKMDWLLIAGVAAVAVVISTKQKGGGRRKRAA